MNWTCKLATSFLGAAVFLSPAITAQAAPAEGLVLPLNASSAAIGSGWTLVAAALADGDSATMEAQGLVEQGLPGVVRIHDMPGGQRLYRVAIGSFATKAEAESYGAQVKSRYGLTQIWAARY